MTLSKKQKDRRKRIGLPGGRGRRTEPAMRALKHLRAKSRLRRLRYETALRRQPYLRVH